MNPKGNLALAVLAGISIGAVSVMVVHAQEAKTPPRLSDRGNRRNRPRCLSEVRREGSGNAGAFPGQLPLCRPWRQDSGSRGPTAEEHRGARVRQHRQSSRLV